MAPRRSLSGGGPQQVLRRALCAATRGMQEGEALGDYQLRINEAANLICTEDCCRFAVDQIDAVLQGKSLDHRAMLYVVDAVLRRADNSKMRSFSDPVAQEMKKAFLPKLTSWLRRCLSLSTRQRSREKVRGLVAKWRDAGHLKVEDLALVLDLLDGMQEDSQSSQADGGQPKGRQSLVASPAAAVPALRRSGPLNEDSQSSQASSQGTKRPAPQPAPEPAPQPAPEPAPTRRRVLPSGASAGVAAANGKAGSGAGAPEADAELQPGEPPLPVEVWPVLGDCRCLFRAVFRALEDPCNRLPRNERGECLEEEKRDKELLYADKLRSLVCRAMLLKKDEVAALLEDPNLKVEEYIKKMEDWRTWGDEICLQFLPDIVKCPIQVYSLNAQQWSFFDAGMYLPRDKERHKKECLFLWYNGRSHYDLVSTPWLQRRQEALLRGEL